MSFRFLFLVLLFPLLSIGQRIVNYEKPETGDIHITESISIPVQNPGYTAWIPDLPTGLVLFTRSRRDTINMDSMINYCLRKDLAIMYACTNNRLEFFFLKDKMEEISTYLIKVVNENNIPKDRIFLCGMSLEGTRALKLTKYLMENHPEEVKIRAAAICDAPLDMQRFYTQGIKTIKVDYNPIASNEAFWVTTYLSKNLGGAPSEIPEAYIDYSPYSYIAENGGNALLLKDLAVRAYTEPDVNWWIDTRRKDYYSMNAIDLAAFINQQKILGNETSELIITNDLGYFPDGTRHPHSWSIVDEKDLIDWFIGLPDH